MSFWVEENISTYNMRILIFMPTCLENVIFNILLWMRKGPCRQVWPSGLLCGPIRARFPGRKF